jgi:hypothetical protein
MTVTHALRSPPAGRLLFAPQIANSGRTEENERIPPENTHVDEAGTDQQMKQLTSR